MIVTRNSDMRKEFRKDVNYTPNYNIAGMRDAPWSGMYRFDGVDIEVYDVWLNSSNIPLVLVFEKGDIEYVVWSLQNKHALECGYHFSVSDPNKSRNTAVLIAHSGQVDLEGFSIEEKVDLAGIRVLVQVFQRMFLNFPNGTRKILTMAVSKDLDYD